jgi:hypothetical protein
VRPVGRLQIGKPELIAALGLIIYTFGRFLAAGGTMSKYGVDARWFLFWDAVPIPAYVWAIGRLVRGLTDPTYRLVDLVVASIIAIVAFMCPYLYLFYAGASEFPASAWLILLLIIGLLAANAVRDVRSKVRAAREGEASGLDTPDIQPTPPIP